MPARARSMAVVAVVAACALPALAQRTPGEIPKPGTYEGSVEIQRRQEQQRQQSTPTPAPTPDRPVPSGGASASGGDWALAAYAEWQKRPPLAPEKNRLLGRWTWKVSNSATAGSLLSMTNEIGCSLLFGDGSVEFRPASFVNVQRGRETPLGRITYRGGGDRVVGLQQDGARAFLQFDFVSPDRIALSGAPCAMDRVVAAIQAAAQATAPPASRATAVGSGAAFEVLGVTLGRSSVDEVRNNIHARRGRPLIGRVPGTQELRIQVHDRAYGDPRLANVWYDFTDGVLSSVTIIWAREPGTPTLFNERATSLNQRFGPPQSKTASSLQGSMTGASFDLVDEPAHGRVIERYAIAR